MFNSGRQKVIYRSLEHAFLQAMEKIEKECLDITNPVEALRTLLNKPTSTAILADTKEEKDYVSNQINELIAVIKSQDNHYEYLGILKAFFTYHPSYFQKLNEENRDSRFHPLPTDQLALWTIGGDCVKKFFEELKQKKFEEETLKILPIIAKMIIKENRSVEVVEALFACARSEDTPDAVKKEICRILGMAPSLIVAAKKARELEKLLFDMISNDAWSNEIKREMEAIRENFPTLADTDANQIQALLGKTAKNTPFKKDYFSSLVFAVSELVLKLFPEVITEKTIVKSFIDHMVSIINSRDVFDNCGEQICLLFNEHSSTIMAIGEADTVISAVLHKLREIHTIGASYDKNENTIALLITLLSSREAQKVALFNELIQYVFPNVGFYQSTFQLLAALFPALKSTESVDIEIAAKIFDKLCMVLKNRESIYSSLDRIFGLLEKFSFLIIAAKQEDKVAETLADFTKIDSLIALYCIKYIAKILKKLSFAVGNSTKQQPNNIEKQLISLQEYLSPISENLIIQLNSPDPLVRKNACHALGSFSYLMNTPTARKAIAGLFNRLSKETDDKPVKTFVHEVLLAKFSPVFLEAEREQYIQVVHPELPFPLKEASAKDDVIIIMKTLYSLSFKVKQATANRIMQAISDKIMQCFKSLHYAPTNWDTLYIFNSMAIIDKIIYPADATAKIDKEHEHTREQPQLTGDLIGRMLQPMMMQAIKQQGPDRSVALVYGKIGQLIRTKQDNAVKAHLRNMFFKLRPYCSSHIQDASSFLDEKVCSDSKLLIMQYAGFRI